MTATLPAARAEIAAVLDRLGDILARTDPIARAFAGLVARGGTDRRAAVRDDLTALRPAITVLLDEYRGWVAGAGAVVRPHLLADAPHWLEWWWPPAGGRPEPLRVNLDETAPDFFDYTSAEWYAVPAASGAPYAAGPYVDHLCTTEYSVTLTAPVVVDGDFVGVVGGDVLVASLEPLLVPALRRIGPDAVLATGAGRVVASATAALAPGHRVPDDLPPGRPLRARHPVGGLDGWRVVRVGG